MKINGTPATRKQAWERIQKNMPELAKEMLAHPNFMRPMELRK